DLQLHGPPRAFLLCLRSALVDSVVLARDDDLTRTVVVRGPHAEDLPAEPLDDLVVQTEDRRPRAGTLPGGLGHREPALANERDGLADADRLGGGQRGELADRVPDH